LIASNLRREAEARGVDAGRLVFAEKAPLADHLARHSVADLFLGTLPYGAHTTASDALWAGLPVLTCAGTAFSGRVAASLLLALGSPELITASLSDYEARAMQLAENPALLSALKDKLAQNRLGAPPFDTARYTRALEAAYISMWDLRCRGAVPQAFRVNDS
jgi:protein O-GlcNAc transferase